MNNWKKYVLPVLIGLSALTVSASAAIYSVSGLAKLFAGASLQVMIMAGSLEAAKLVTATLLHQYWDDLTKLLKIYLTTAVVVLVLITSMGIYGFLSAAYQSTAVGFETTNKEVVFLKQKEAFFQKDVDRFDAELNRISNTITELSKARTVQYEVSDGQGGSRSTISTAELRIAADRIKTEEQNRAEVFASRNTAADSLQNIQTQILNLEVQASSNSELGPLIYISELTGRPMSVIINILLLIIIFVFDPLAIALVLAANFAFDKVINNKQEPVIEAKKESEKQVETVGIRQQEQSIVEKVEPGIQKQIKEEPVEEDTAVEEETFDATYTGVEFKDIVKILQKTPGYYAVLLKNGKRVKLPKDLYYKLEQNHNNVITY